ncbi:site-2 protease family protein [Candidatus Saccharibacteria bacterium TM7i]|nr:site-2 protease family protein [Candidatus Saccharibacteria bacterium TM7i]
MLLHIAIVLGAILISMTLHEAMHAFVSYWLGDTTAKEEGRLTLNPIKHIDPFLTIILPVMLALVGAPIFGGAKPVPFRPDRVKGGDWGAALVALGGPLTNLFIAFIAFGAGVLLGLITPAGFAATIPGLIVMTMVTVNLGFFVFNMLPIPPLDGSRVLYALAPEFVRKGMRFIEQFGIIFVFAFVLLASAALGTYLGTVIQFFIDVFTTIFRL